MKCFAILISILMASAAAAVEPEPDYARTGVYVGLGGLGAIENFGAGGFSNGGGVNARVGYRLLPNLAAEGMFEWVGGFSLGPVDLDAWSLTANAKAFLTTGQIQPYLLVGIGVSQAELEAFGVSVDATDFVARLGGGVDFYLTESWVLDLEVAYILPTGDIDGTDYISIGAGVQYRF